ncbi:MAG: DUF3842 family protein [Clostridia bacterium]|nr:DUF3842 family protein [Clostridia bacterium]
MDIGVVDGQGGGVGRAIITALRERLPEANIIALGTNAVATAAMLRAGANEGATGENAIVVTAPRCNLLLGPIGLVLANAMLGEVTPRIAEAIGSSTTMKILIPIQKANVRVAGLENASLPALISQAVEMAAAFAENA